MKRGEPIDGVSASAIPVAPSVTTMVRDGGRGGGLDTSLEAKIDEQTSVLRELLQVVKLQTELLRGSASA